MEDFNEKLKKWFADQKIKQTDIAERLGVSPTIVNNYLNGARQFGKNVALKWSNEFGLNPLWLISAPENFSGYDGAETYLGMMVGKAEQGNRVLVGLYGDKTIHDFRDNQQYVIVSFDWGKDEKWRIKQVEANGAKYQFFVIVNADNFIKKLRSAKHIAISLPVYKEGVHTFHFGTGGYPLDW